jgi:hypothetical protein
MELFDKVLLAEKGGLILLLIITSFINGYKDYISINPRKFVGDCVVSGATGAIALAIIANMRGHPDKALSVAITTFMLLFMFNVLLELSGVNAASVSTKNMKKVEKVEERILKWPVIVTAIVGLLLMAFLAFKTNVPLVGSSLPKEALIFGLSSGLSAAYVAITHGSKPKDTAIAAAGATGFFALLHVTLQKGGFYNLVF